jgi:dTDP-4-amino-4,6-dideoxygalactose transaminase
MRVPFNDLHAQYLANREEFDQAIAQVVARSAFISGEFAHAFEQEWARTCGVRHCIAVANGTDALYIVLRMLGVGPGDEVITTACSWISTSETISQTGANPVFVDVDNHFLIDPALVEKKITPRTRVVLPVHLYGQAVPMGPLLSICQGHGLALLEDCAQAHLASWAKRPVGSFGIAGTFSFYPGKNLGAWGDAGAIVTNDDALARKCRLYANHGALTKHEHEIEGLNSRMDGMQAALLSTKLRHLAAWTKRRQEIAAFYDAQLRSIPEIELPVGAYASSHVYHLFVIRTPRRDELRAYLAAKGIETAIHYPSPLPLLPIYRRLMQDSTDFPKARAFQSQILSLPIFPEMTEEMIGYVCNSIHQFFGC